MKPKPTRRNAARLPHDQRVADIMAAARTVIVAKGYENASMSDIAEQAGLADGTLYRYFENKNELLLKVAEAWFEEQLSADPDLPSIQGTWNKLRHLIWRALNITRRAPALSRYVLTELRPNPHYRSTPFFELNRRYTAEIREVCRQAIQNGEFRKDVSASLLRDMVFGCIEHRTWAFLRGEGEFRIDELADGIATVVYRGMLAEPDRGAPIGAVVARLEKVAAVLERHHGIPVLEPAEHSG